MNLPWRHRNNKFLYYLKGYLRTLLPVSLFEGRYLSKVQKFNSAEINYIARRVNYYNKLNHITKLPEQTPPIGSLKIPKKQKVYYFDNVEYTRYFNQNLLANFLGGDITFIPESPTILKSRPIATDQENENSILLKLNKVRHFTYVKDNLTFREKKDLLIGRAGVTRPHRIRFFEKYFNHPMCDIGKTNKGRSNDAWLKPKITIDQHLHYKFILCLEGNDVATNLKWVMSSNSLAVMPRPTYETWFMEGTLLPNFHYVEIRSDYADLEERLTYYINHPEEAEEISRNANTYIEQFKNKEREDLISFLVLEKYFYKTGQIAYRQNPFFK